MSKKPPGWKSEGLLQTQTDFFSKRFVNSMPMFATAN